jgi:hypothetical protein
MYYNKGLTNIGVLFLKNKTDKALFNYIPDKLDLEIFDMEVPSIFLVVVLCDSTLTRSTER